MNRPHILISGGQGEGKSVLANRILLALGRPYAGVRSVRAIEQHGRTAGFDLRDLLTGRSEPITRLGEPDVFPPDGSMAVNTEPFTSQGVPALREGLGRAEREGGVLLLDELGRFEQDSTDYLDAVRDMFRQEQVPVICVLKKEQLALNVQLWAEPGRLRLDLDETAPDKALTAAIAYLQPWIRRIRQDHPAAPAQHARRLRLVVMAAGLSRRFGDKDKLLHPWNGGPLYRPVLRAVAACTRAFPGQVMGVVVANRTAIRRESADLGLVTLDNPDAASGQASSIKRGLAAPLVWPAGTNGGEAVVFIPADQPGLSAEGLQGFCEEAQTTPCGLLRSISKTGRYGSPVSFDRIYYAELLELTGDQGGKAVLKRHPEDQATYLMPDSELQDIDTPADLPD